MFFVVQAVFTAFCWKSGEIRENFKPGGVSMAHETY